MSVAAATPRPASLSFLKPRLHASTHNPKIIDGEQEIACLLHRRGIRAFHEGIWFPLCYQLPSGDWRDGAFCPDFYLPPTSTRPALCLEVTFADHNWPASNRLWVLANRQRLALKRVKIELTAGHYGIETILVTRRVFKRLMRDESHLDHLIRQAVRRHWRRQRRNPPNPA